MVKIILFYLFAGLVCGEIGVVIMVVVKFFYLQ